MKKISTTFKKMLELEIPSNPIYSSYEEFEESKIKCRDCHVGSVYDRVICSDGCKDHPKIVICGEAPGRDEVDQGVPFVGKAGKLLRNVINKVGFRRDNALITNVIPCRPLNNKFPSDVILIKNCASKWLAQELALLKPEALLLLGNQPLKFLLGQVGITSKRGTWMKLGDIHVMPTYHPSYVLRKRYMKDGKEIITNFVNDVREVARLCGIPS